MLEKAMKGKSIYYIWHRSTFIHVSISTTTQSKYTFNLWYNSRIFNCIIKRTRKQLKFIIYAKSKKLKKSVKIFKIKFLYILFLLYTYIYILNNYLFSQSAYFI